MSKIAPTGQIPSSAVAIRLLLFLAPTFAPIAYLHDMADLRDSPAEDLLAEMAESITRLAIKHRPRTEDNSETARWLVFWIQEGQDIYDTALFINDMGIADVGPERARQLVQTFKGVDNFIAASEEDLIRVPKIGPVLAKEIFDAKPGTA